ncbi:hypothetical protein EWM64_g1195 [Hericium alpestre]|uniref:Uncharacterized protein n=1 Tax=Hericium alpestre TaxID=135208 RepID=A0A4Z0A947_9AGAM|nr:hypothetical protein EWM64_g1195 [Hericium alpestre]
MQSSTPYMNMLVEADQISVLTNLSAFFFTFITLWGFVTLPGTYAELQMADIDNDSERHVVTFILKIPLLTAAIICCTIGLIGILVLWCMFHHNLIWVFNHLFVPGFFNGLTGFATTLAEVYGLRDGSWTKMDKIIGLATGIVLLTFGILTLWRYNNLKVMRDSHGIYHVLQQYFY